MTDDGHGKTYGRFTLPTAQAQMLTKILHGFAAPKHQAATQGPGIQRRPGPERMGRAFWSSSSATRPTGSRTPAASPPPRWS